ncbi:SapC family protein [Planctobacterium marinum]|uniref:SapC family protein n=1 Tax=Planctobacterium marinum TaxID=1631968 RepID=A0AA48HM41_9ALTE|nr:SapC family protein [Planctobacterium marinum]
MSKLVALSRQTHQQVRIDKSKVEQQASELHMIPVVLSEFRKLLVHYPIVFSKSGETGQFMCSALLGFEQGENLFWQQGAWQGIYVPLQVTRQPFFLGQQETGSGQEPNSAKEPVMCINEAHPAVGNKGEALFDAQGQPSQYLQNQQRDLMTLLQGEQLTQQFIARLLELGLLTAMSLQIQFADNSSTKVNGLYTIDEDKLDALDNDTLAELQQAGYLSAIYAMVHSTGQIYNLIDKKNQRLNQAQSWFKAAGQD